MTGRKPPDETLGLADRPDGPRFRDPRSATAIPFLYEAGIDIRLIASRTCLRRKILSVAQVGPPTAPPVISPKEPSPSPLHRTNRRCGLLSSVRRTIHQLASSAMTVGLT